MLLVAFLVHIIIYTLQGSSTVHQYQQMPGLGSYQLANYHYKHCCRDCPSHWNIYVTIVLLEIRTLKTTFIYFFFYVDKRVTESLSLFMNYKCNEWWTNLRKCLTSCMFEWTDQGFMLSASGAINQHGCSCNWWPSWNWNGGECWSGWKYFSGDC